MWSAELYQKQCTSQLYAIHIQEVAVVLDMIVNGLPAFGNDPIWSAVWNLQTNNLLKTIL
jgi:hypothetical protein